MTKRNQTVVRQGREEKKATRGRVVKEKFVEARDDGRHAAMDTRPLVPRNDKQRTYIQLIQDHSLVIATGFAGTSKTYIPTVIACDALLSGAIDKIVFTRPNISNSASLGMFKGSAIEKMEMWLMPVMNILRARLSPGGLESHLENGNIQFVPMEVVKGYSAENCFFIVDEGEDISIDEAKKIVTRQGKGCKMIISGDVSQSELKERSGLKHLAYMANKYSNIDCGFIDFNHVNDIERSDACKQWVIAFTKEEKEAA